MGLYKYMWFTNLKNAFCGVNGEEIQKKKKNLNKRLAYIKLPLRNQQLFPLLKPFVSQHHPSQFPSLLILIYFLHHNPKRRRYRSMIRHLRVRAITAHGMYESLESDNDLD